jgi:hypothetical protein
MRQRSVWRTPEGAPVSCAEKLKVLDQNLAEFKALAQDMMEDAALMGCDIEQVRDVLKTAVANLSVRYPNK